MESIKYCKVKLPLLPKNQRNNSPAFYDLKNVKGSSDLKKLVNSMCAYTKLHMTDQQVLDLVQTTGRHYRETCEWAARALPRMFTPTTPMFTAKHAPPFASFLHPAKLQLTHNLWVAVLSEPKIQRLGEGANHYVLSRIYQDWNWG